MPKLMRCKFVGAARRAERRQALQPVRRRAGFVAETARERVFIQAQLELDQIAAPADQIAQRQPGGYPHHARRAPCRRASGLSLRAGEHACCRRVGHLGLDERRENPGCQGCRPPGGAAPARGRYFSLVSFATDVRCTLSRAVDASYPALSRVRCTRSSRGRRHCAAGWSWASSRCWHTRTAPTLSSC